MLLTALGDIATRRGWSVVNVSGKEALCASIQEQLVGDTRLRDLNVQISLPFVSAGAKIGDSGREPSFREAFARATRSLSQDGAGLLITVDEAQDASRDDMAVIAANVQYMIREGQNVGLLFAGITTGVLDLLNGEGVTFLRRAQAEELASIPRADVARALRKTIEASGLAIEDAALAQAAADTCGYAYLIQLVGYYTWRERRRHVAKSVTINVEDVRRGTAAAVRQYGQSMIETALAGLTKPALDYLLAMTEDNTASSTAAVARRMGKPTASANTYRRMLISRQVIEATAPGYVAFSMPFMREYLVKHEDDLLARYGASACQEPVR